MDCDSASGWGRLPEASISQRHPCVASIDELKLTYFLIKLINLFMQKKDLKCQEKCRTRCRRVACLSGAKRDSSPASFIPPAEQIAFQKPIRFPSQFIHPELISGQR